MPQNYTPEFKMKIVRLHEEEGHTYKSITSEYGAASPNGAANYAKNARQAPNQKPNTIT